MLIEVVLQYSIRNHILTLLAIIPFKETLKELFPSWFDIKRHEEVVIFTCGLMQDATPLINHVYDMYIGKEVIEMHQNQWRLAQWNRIGKSCMTL